MPLHVLEPDGEVSEQQTAGGRHSAALDGVRGLAILLVMLFHFAAGAGTPPSWVDGLVRRLASAGWTGVDLFFVLSGFLITGSLLDARGERNYFRNFWGRRILRIFPLYYGFLLAWIFVLPHLLGERFPTIPEGSRIWLLTYTSNIRLAVTQAFSSVPPGTGHFWSLAVEEQFYLLWPVAVFFQSGRQLARFCVACIVTACGIRIVLAFGVHNAIAPYVLMVTRMDALAVGGLLAVAARDRLLLHRLAVWARPLVAGSVVVLACLAVAMWDTPEFLSAYDARVQAFGYLPLAVLAGALVGYAAMRRKEPGVLAGWMLWSSMRMLGRYSYGLYVFHVPLAKALGPVLVPDGTLPSTFGFELPAQIALIALLSAASLVPAILSYHLFEVHFLRLKRHFRGPAQVEPALG